MFVFTINEASGYRFTTNNLTRLEKYLLNTSPREFDFSIELKSACQFIDRLKVTKAITAFGTSYESTRNTLSMHINFVSYHNSLEDKLVEIPNPLHDSIVGSNYEFAVELLIKEIIICCMLNASDTLFECYDNGISSMTIRENHHRWSFTIKAIDDSGESTIIDSENIRNPIMYDREVFNAYVIFNLLLGTPVVIGQNSFVYAKQQER